MDGDERLRLFLGLRLPDDVVRTLVAWAASELAGAGGRLVPSEHVHVTLAFLGSRPASELPAIVGELREAASAAAPIELEPARWRASRSVGMVVLHDHGGAAGQLADDLHGRLEALGVYRREGRPWLPHVTVVRVRERLRARPELPQLGRFAPSDAAAFLSRLHRAGARYEVLESTALGGVRG